MENIIKPATIEEAFELRPVSPFSRAESESFNNLVRPIVDLEVESKMNTETITYDAKPFIIANTQDVALEMLKNKCVIPVFTKDNEKTIAHQEFIELTQDCISEVFSNERFDVPEIRVSHQIKGRVPTAIYKSAKDLEEHEKTQYFERMAFIIKIPSISTMINGNEVALTVGGVRSYNQENLYNKKSFEKFKFFVGFQNQVCGYANKKWSLS
ncbi:DUF3871 domain-containing protein [Flavobacterium antarcticum]|uniref:DUF3871 family protein n=1 Tax=Flavobacterium antarcticum TaxID=271155 RepID=UPI0003B78B2D|nr:DUF3871 family protein [Flavobacterium antarcticum]